MHCRAFGWTLAVLLMGWPSAAVRAGNPPGGAVSGEGMVTLCPVPSALRMHVQLCAYGKTVKLALDRLKTRREAALERLRALEADKASIRVARPTVSEQTPPRLRALAPVPDAPSGYTPPPAPRVSVDAPERPEAPQERPPGFRARERGRAFGRLFTAYQTLTGDWPLESGDLEALLASAHGIRERVKAADLGGGDYAQGLSAEEQELVEESLVVATPAGPYAAAPYTPGPRPVVPAAAYGMRPGTPRFLYVARIAPQQRKQALARSFAQAKAQAAELAEAAGARLGPLLELSGRVCGDSPGAPATYRGASVGKPAGGPDSSEATAADPNALRFTFPVTARFRLD